MRMSHGMAAQALRYFFDDHLNILNRERVRWLSGMSPLSYTMTGQSKCHYFILLGRPYIATGGLMFSTLLLLCFSLFSTSTPKLNNTPRPKLGKGDDPNLEKIEAKF